MTTEEKHAALSERNLLGLLADGTISHAEYRTLGGGSRLSCDWRQSSHGLRCDRCSMTVANADKALAHTECTKKVSEAICMAQYGQPTPPEQGLGRKRQVRGKVGRFTVTLG